jgi:hypothetical protein
MVFFLFVFFKAIFLHENKLIKKWEEHSNLEKEEK